MLEDVFNLVTVITPYILPVYMIMGSFFNRDPKGIAFVIGLILNAFVTDFIAKVTNLRGSNPEVSARNRQVCEFNPFKTMTPNINALRGISLNTSIITFTLAYVVLPMILVGSTINYTLVLVLLSILVVNFYMQQFMRCFNSKGAAGGAVVGFMVGMLYAFMLDGNGNMKNLLYNIDGIAPGEQCKITAKRYKCSATT